MKRIFDRRTFLTTAAEGLAGVAGLVGVAALAGLSQGCSTPSGLFRKASGSPQVALSIDDLRMRDYPACSRNEVTDRILEALAAVGNLRVIYYVIGQNLEREGGRHAIEAIDAAGHLIGNHTYSHPDYHSSTIDFETFSADFLRCDQAISGFRGYTKRFRAPMLHRGNTKEKRDSLRELLAAQGYQPGYCSIDNYDWYIDRWLEQLLHQAPQRDIAPLRDYYLRHLTELSQFNYENAIRVFDRPIPHVLLLHHNLTTALFLPDLIAAYRDMGWELIAPEVAYADPAYSRQPDIVPDHNSLVFAAGREKGISGRELVHPAEDDEYIDQELEKLSL